jgi:hypothetical protein
MAWIIDRDYINGGEGDTCPSRVGTASLGPDLHGETFRFRLLDDDGEVYYGGRYDQAAADNDDDTGGLYEANQWGMYDAGAVNLEVKVADGIRFGLTGRDYCDKYGLTDTDWVSIYG